MSDAFGNLLIGKLKSTKGRLKPFQLVSANLGIKLNWFQPGWEWPECVSIRGLQCFIQINGINSKKNYSSKITPCFHPAGQGEATVPRHKSSGPMLPWDPPEPAYESRVK